MAQKKELVSKICLPRTSSLTSSYSAPASLHLRCSALQNATTSITSDGNAPKLISLSRLPLSFLKVEESLQPHSAHVCVDLGGMFGEMSRCDALRPTIAGTPLCELFPRERSRCLDQTRYGCMFDKDSRILCACNKDSKKERESLKLKNR